MKNFLQIFRDKRIDRIDKGTATDTTFYGPATNCNELGNLGYTLNGYYLVKGNDESKSIEAVFCRFKLPRGSKTSKNWKGTLLWKKLNSFSTIASL